MTVYSVPTPLPHEVSLSFSAAEIKALREAVGELGYNLPGLSSANNKLRQASKAVKP